MSLAFVADDLVHHAAALLTQDPDGVLHCRLFGEADAEHVVQSGAPRAFPRSVRDGMGGRSVSAIPVIGTAAGTSFPGSVRCCSTLHTRPLPGRSSASGGTEPRPQQCANAFRKPHGRTFSLPGGDVEAFPTPAESARGRLVSEPRAAAHRPSARDRPSGAGRCCSNPAVCSPWRRRPRWLRSRELPGIGPMYATLILLRSTGATDILTLGEPRLAVLRRPFLRARAHGR